MSIWSVGRSPEVLKLSEIGDRRFNWSFGLLFQLGVEFRVILHVLSLFLRFFDHPNKRVHPSSAAAVGLTYTSQFASSTLTPTELSHTVLEYVGDS